jgi:hypothetical protein
MKELHWGQVGLESRFELMFLQRTFLEKKYEVHLGHQRNTSLRLDAGLWKLPSCKFEKLQFEVIQVQCCFFMSGWSAGYLQHRMKTIISNCL